jgi:hypothetical protein
MSDPASDQLRAENERLRADNQQLRAEIERLRRELQRLGRYLRDPEPTATAPGGSEAPIGWAYQRGDLEDDLGDD